MNDPGQIRLKKFHAMFEGKMVAHLVKSSGQHQSRQPGCLNESVLRCIKGSGLRNFGIGRQMTCFGFKDD
jgi:hypothetical protein